MPVHKVAAISRVTKSPVISGTLNVSDDALGDRGGPSIRRIAEQTGAPKSSVHRRSQAIERRNVSPATLSEHG